MLAALCLFSAKIAMAQVCFSYSNDLAEYDSASLSSDGTTIYTMVEIDGSQEMDLQPGCLYLTPIHTPEATNLLIMGSQYVGGSQEGAGVCGSCYVSFGNEQSIAPPQGYSVTFQSESRVDCNIGGTFFDTGLTESWVATAVTTYHIATINADGTVTFRQACPGTSVASCGAANYLGSEPTNWAEEFQLKFTIGGGGPRCFPVSLVQYLNGPPAPYPCD